MTKRVGPVLLLLLVATFGFGQTINLGELNADIQTLFTSIGRDVSPSLHQMAVSGFDSVGEARLSGWTRFYLTPLSVGISSFNGIAKVLASDNPDDWQFTLVSIPDLIKDSAAAEQTAANAYDMLTTKFMFLPSFRLGFGFPLPWDLELLVNGFYTPPALIDWGLNLAMSSLPNNKIDLKALQAHIDMFTLGGTVRKIILNDNNDFWRPALSIGASYVYSSTSLGADNFSLDAVGVEVGPDQTGGMGTLAMSGKLGFQASTQAVGAVVHVSKNLLWFFTPFAKAAAYYHISDYQSTFQVHAIVDPQEPTGIPNDPANNIEENLDSPVKLVSQDVSIILSGGFELKIPLLVLFFAASLDMEQPIIDIQSFAINGFALNGVAANIGIRLQI